MEAHPQANDNAFNVGGLVDRTYRFRLFNVSNISMISSCSSMRSSPPGRLAARSLARFNALLKSLV